jgi:thiamine biosynthesis lipoprotein
MSFAVLRSERFRAMGTECLVSVTTRPEHAARARAALAAARTEIAACERALSRFDPESDLSRLNDAGGAWADVDERLVDALAEALRARVETGGLYDPTILPVLTAAGYDRSFDKIVDRAPVQLHGWCAGGRIELDHERLRARLAAGSAVDLGGIGKGFAAERALAAVERVWPEAPGAIIDLGGDIAAAGQPPDRGAWRIAVDDARAPGSALGTLALAAGGVATSGRNTRRFGSGLHHLIDPREGCVAANGPLAVTVVATRAVQAEAHATALAISDTDDAVAYVSARPGLGALLVPEAGEPTTCGALPFFEQRQTTGATT